MGTYDVSKEGFAIVFSGGPNNGLIMHMAQLPDWIGITWPGSIISKYIRGTDFVEGHVVYDFEEDVTRNLHTV